MHDMFSRGFIVKKLIIIGLICFLFIGLCGCDTDSETDYVLGKDMFQMPEHVGSGVIVRHDGYSFGYYSDRPQEAATYINLIKQLRIQETNRKGSLTAGIYEICFDSVICDENTHEIKEVISVWLVIDDNLILYDDQWYEANTSQLLRQLERDFADVA